MGNGRRLGRGMGRNSAGLVKEYVMAKTDHVKAMSQQYGAKVPAKLKSALNHFFNLHDEVVDGLIFQPGYMQGSNAPVVLIIESSFLYDYLQGDYGWAMHTAWHNQFDGSGYYPEMINSCQIAFYKE